MKRIFTLTLAIFLVFSCGALAESVLNVTGSGTVYVAADRVSASLGISINGEDLGDLQNQANEIMNAICKALKDAGLEDGNISTNYLYISPRYDYTSEMERITGYSISNSLTIITDDIDSIGSYIDAAFAAGANTFDSISFTVKDDTQAQQKALELAVADAQGKAEVIAAAAGRTLGDIKSISQGSEEDYNYYNTTVGKGMYISEDGEMDGASSLVHAAQIRVNAEVQISYELK